MSLAHEDLDPKSGGPVGQVLEVVDADKAPGLIEFLELGDDPFGTDEVGKFRDDDRLPVAADRFDLGPGPDSEAAAAGLVGLTDAVVDDDAATREVGSGTEGQEFVVRRPGPALGHHQLDGGVQLVEVVGRHVGRHADCDTRGAVEQQAGEQGGKDDGLLRFAVVGGAEVDGALVEFPDHGHGGLAQPALGVAGGGGWVVEGPEVALWVDERDPAGEVLAHADQGVVDGGVAVGVVAAHRVAHDAGALAVRCVGPDSHAQHGVENASLYGLEAVADIGNRTRGDDRERVGEERRAHLLGDRDVDDLPGEGSLVVEQFLLLGHRAGILGFGCARGRMRRRSTTHDSMPGPCDRPRMPSRRR